MKILAILLERMRCKPEDWDFPSIFRDCRPEELAVFSDLGLYNSEDKRLLMPCRYILDLWHEYEFDSDCHNEEGVDGTFRVKVVYNKLPFKEINFIPSHTLWGLMTNIFTIVGVILGVSCCEIPDFLRK